MNVNRAMITLLPSNDLKFTLFENREEKKMTSNRSFIIFQAPQYGSKSANESKEKQCNCEK